MIEPVARADLVLIAKAYAKATGTELSAVSRKFYGKAGFLKAFGKGKCSMTFSNFDRLLTAFRENWPAGTPWPATALTETGMTPATPAAPGGLFAAFQGMARKQSPRLNASA